jgi:hypothetical protein
MEEILLPFEALGLFFGADVTKYGALVSGLVGVYKVATNRDRRERHRDKAHLEIDGLIDQRIAERIEEYLDVLRGHIYSAASEIVSAKQDAGAIAHKVQYKSIPLTMPSSTLLDKIDVSIKGAISKTLIGHIKRDLDEHRYHEITQAERDALLPSHAKHLRDILWLRMSKDAGFSEVMRQAYDTGASYEIFHGLMADLSDGLITLERDRMRKKEAWDDRHGYKPKRKRRRKTSEANE